MRQPPVIRAGLDGAEPIHAVRIGGGAAPAAEVRRIVAAAAVRLPDLDHDLVERPAVELRDAAAHLDHLARRRATVEHGEIVRAARELGREERSERHFSRWHELHGRDGVAPRPRTTSWYS